MTRTLRALVPVLAFTALLARPAAGYTLPNGNVVWDVSGGGYDIRIEQFHGDELGLMSYTDRVNGPTRTGDLSPAFVYDRDSAMGLADEFFARGLFGSLEVTIQMVDRDGVAFDGATTGKGYPGAFLPGTPPPLSLFEGATITFSPEGGAPQTLFIDALPEPGVELLVAALLASLAIGRLID